MFILHFLRRIRPFGLLPKHPASECVATSLHGAGTLRKGPPAVALARNHFIDRADVTIDPLETEFRVEPSGLAVRAWVIIDVGSVPGELLGSLIDVEDRLSAVPPLARRIFFLGASYGLSTSEIARLLGLSRRQIRRWLLRAIASIDAAPR